MCRPRRSSGFTLLEILVAIAIFAFIAAAAMQTMANSDFMAASGRRARDLRMLAERKLGEVLAFEQHFDENAPLEGDFSDWTEYGEQFKDWKWQLDVRGEPGRPLVAYGIWKSDDCDYLFGAPTEDEKARAVSQNAGGAPAGGQQPGGQQQQTREGDAQSIRELTLRVTASDAEGAADSVELVLFATVLDAKKPGTAAPK